MSVAHTPNFYSNYGGFMLEDTCLAGIVASITGNLQVNFVCAEKNNSYTNLFNIC